MSRDKNWGPVVKKEQVYHINLLKLLSIKFVLLTFRKMMNLKSVRIQVDKQNALSYLFKMEGTKSQ